MNYRRLGKTGLMVSEIGLGAEWLERQDAAHVKAVIDRCEEKGINILDCWMCEPNVRSNIGAAIAGKREKWIIQGHLGSTWQDGQYVRTRELGQVKKAFDDLMNRLGTDYIDIGMIHYVDTPEEFEELVNGEFIEFVRELKKKGIIRHIGLSSHNPAAAKLAAQYPEIEMILFSVNPAYDLMPDNDDNDKYFTAEYFENATGGIAPQREEFYKLCETNDVGLTVMKAYAGGRLFSAERSPFGVALTPVQCLHYALTRPAVASVLAGYVEPKHVDDAVAYESASDEEKDYASVLAKAPRHAFGGQCTYCGHCQPCPAGIDIAMVNKLYDLAEMHEEAPNSVKEHYMALSARAGDCIGCAGCECRCPFGVEVVKRMEKAKALFGA